MQTLTINYDGKRANRVCRLEADWKAERKQLTIDVLFYGSWILDLGAVLLAVDTQ